MLNSPLKWLHTQMVFNRRVKALASAIAPLVPDNSSVLDIGCGSGHISMLLLQQKKNIDVQGLEVMTRPGCLIPCRTFDGKTLQLKDSSVDVCMFVDVLHHAAEPRRLLQEAARVTRKYVVIKDHLCQGRLDYLTLKFMDWVGNRPHGVALRYGYMNRAEWDKLFSETSLRTVAWNERLALYPFPASLFFGRGLHFIALLEKQ